MKVFQECVVADIDVWALRVLKEVSSIFLVLV